MFGNVVFLGHTASIKKGLKKNHLKEIKYLKQLEDKFLVEHLNNLQHIHCNTKNKLCKVFS